MQTTVSTTAQGKATQGRRRSLRSLGPVLIVEDDGLVALDIAEALSNAGVKSVVTCSSVVEAMAELEREMPALLVLDVHLADRGDGWALAELASQLGDSPPLILFTTATPAAIPATAAGLGKVLPKPFHTDALIALIEKERSTGLFGRIRQALSGE